jgi:hypothetical protein
MSTSADQSTPPEIENIVETMFGMAHSWLGMIEGMTRAAMRNPLAYSASTEAANLLARTANLGNGGMTDAAREQSERRAREGGQHREQD